MEILKRNLFALISSLFFSQWIILVHAEDGNGGRVLNCVDEPTQAFSQHYMLFEDEQVCCGNEKYYLGTTSEHLQYFKDCNVEPKNDSLSLEDSYWTFFDCLIKMSMGSKQFTEAEYVAWMARNLSVSKQSAILSIVKNTKLTPLNSNGNNELQTIKTYWTSYFDAEYQVCTKAMSLSDSSKEVVKKYWDPSDCCINGKSPKIFFLSVKHQDTLKCVKSFVDKNPVTNLNSTIPFNDVMYTSCTLILGGLLTEEDLIDDNLNYEALVTNGLPKFFSKSLKIKVLKEFLDNARVKYGNQLQASASESVGIQDIALEILKNQQEILQKEINTEKKNMFLNIFTINEVVAQLFEIVNNICYGPPTSSNPNSSS